MLPPARPHPASAAPPDRPGRRASTASTFLVTHRPRSAGATLLGAVALLLACGPGGEPTGPATGAVAVSVTTTGDDGDADGYALTIDGGAARPLPAAGALSVGDLAAGEHTLELSGVAANCGAVGGTRRAVRVVAGAATTVALTVACAPLPPGAAFVTAPTTGFDPDGDGYQVSVDGGAPESLATGERLAVPGLRGGPHRFRLSGVASNCSVSGENPRTVEVASGATAPVVFPVTCRTLVARVVVTRRLPSLLERDTTLLTAAAVAADGTPLPGRAVAWTTDGPAVAAVAPEGVGGAQGLVTGLAPGRATVTATVDGVGGSAVVAVIGRALRPNREIAYLADVALTGGSGVVRQLRVADAAGAGARTVSPAGRFVVDFAWSPDGSRFVVAYQDPATGGPAGLFTLTADGSGESPLGPAAGWAPEWSPDGSAVAYWNPDDAGHGQIYVVAAAGGAAPQLTAAGSGVNELPTWSPDGRRIAYTSRAPGAPDYALWVADLDGLEPPRRIGTAATQQAPAWSPDGKLIAYFREGISLVDADGGHPRLLAGAEGCALGGSCATATRREFPSWSRDGSAVAYSRRERASTGRTTYHMDVVTLGGAAAVVGAANPFSGSAQWSPDNTVLLFSDARAIVRVRPDGADQRVVSGTEPARDPRWRP
jgi:TolB protein